MKILPMSLTERSHIRPKVAAPTFYSTHEQKQVYPENDPPDYQTFLQQNVSRIASGTGKTRKMRCPGE